METERYHNLEWYLLQKIIRFKMITQNNKNT